MFTVFCVNSRIVNTTYHWVVKFIEWQIAAFMILYHNKGEVTWCGYCMFTGGQGLSSV